MSAEAPAIQINRVVRHYQALRPLRIASLSIQQGERVAIGGLDAGASEVLVNLVTGAALPDEGEVRVLGRSTADISSGDEWLASLERFGIVSPRAVLMEGATVRQNLAMPFTLEIDPVPPAVAARVEALAAECGIGSRGSTDGPYWLSSPAGETPPEIRQRLHLARAIALDPLVLLMEHPTAGVEQHAVAALAEDMARALEGRRLATLAITQDETFAARLAHRTLKLQPSTGELKAVRKGWFR
jgi:ABC-type lipoprotein export system ATPase subunit